MSAPHRINQGQGHQLEARNFSAILSSPAARAHWWPYCVQIRQDNCRRRAGQHPYWSGRSACLLPEAGVRLQTFLSVNVSQHHYQKICRKITICNSNVVVELAFQCLPDTSQCKRRAVRLAWHTGGEFNCVVTQPWLDWSADEAGDSELVKLLKV